MISEESKVLRECVNEDVAKLVGEFAAFDTSIEEEYFYEFERYGNSHLVVSKYDFCSVLLGSNLLIHQYKILKRTTKSYVVKYIETKVYVKSVFPTALFDFTFIDFFRLHASDKRVFPFRRSDFDDGLKCLDYLEKQKEIVHMDSDCIIQLNGGDFLINPPKTVSDG